MPFDRDKPKNGNMIPDVDGRVDPFRMRRRTPQTTLEQLEARFSTIDVSSIPQKNNEEKKEGEAGEDGKDGKSAAKKASLFTSSMSDKDKGEALKSALSSSYADKAKAALEDANKKPNDVKQAQPEPAAPVGPHASYADKAKAALAATNAPPNTAPQTTVASHPTDFSKGYQDRIKEAAAQVKAEEVALQTTQNAEKTEREQREKLARAYQEKQQLFAERSFIIRSAQDGTFQGEVWSALAEVNRKLGLPDYDTGGEFVPNNK